MKETMKMAINKRMRDRREASRYERREGGKKGLSN